LFAGLLNKEKEPQMRIAALALLASAAIAAPAAAATDVTFNDGGAPLIAGESIFATFDGGNNGGVNGSGYIIQTGSNLNGAQPAAGDMGDPYLSVLAGGVANFALGEVTRLGLDYGSADAYNTFILSFLNGAVETYTGQDIINAGLANGDQSAPRTNGRVVFSNLTNPIVSLSLRSSQNSLEVDNLSRVAAVPEPGTWALMLVGFGAVGFSMRRRGQRHLPAMA
jgi:hypothetical protein